MLIARFLMAALALAAASIAGAGTLDVCEAHGTQSLSHDTQGYRFTDPLAGEVRFGGGRLFVDGREVSVSADDRTRLLRLESNLDAVVEDAHALALEASALAVDAVSEVALAFFGDDAAVLSRFDQKLAALHEAFVSSLQDRRGPLFDGEAFGQAVESAMESLMPMLAGEIASRAVAVALGGDESAIRDLEARAERLEHEIEAKVEARARDIEARAEAMCPRFEAIAALLGAMDYRHADGRGLLLPAD